MLGGYIYINEKKLGISYSMSTTLKKPERGGGCCGGRVIFVSVVRNAQGKRI